MPALRSQAHCQVAQKAAAHLSTFGFCRNTGHKMKNQKSLNFYHRNEKQDNHGLYNLFRETKLFA